jgi:hypothetical protein
LPEIAPGKPRAANQRTQVQIEVYELTVEDPAVPNLETAKLAQGTRSDVLARLGEIGTARLVHMIDVPLLLEAGEASVKLGSQVPVVEHVVVNARGTRTPSIAFRDIGLRVDVKGAWLEGGGFPVAEALLAVDWAGISTSSVAIGNDVNVPAFFQFKFEQFVQATSGQPLVYLVRQSSAPQDSSQDVTVGIVRVTITQIN